MSGPAPKREAERRRRNKDGIETEHVNIDELVQADVEIPVAPYAERVDPDTGEVTEVPLWEPMVVSFWEAFTRSGQVIFYEPTDWMAAYVLMETLDRWLKPQDVKVGQEGTGANEQGGGDVTYIFEQKIVAMPAGVITAIYKALGDLMAMEGPRRKLRIELERKKAIDAALQGANVIPIEQNRAAAFERAKASRPAEG